MPAALASLLENPQHPTKTPIRRIAPSGLLLLETTHPRALPDLAPRAKDAIPLLPAPRNCQRRQHPQLEAAGALPLATTHQPVSSDQPSEDSVAHNAPAEGDPAELTPPVETAELELREPAEAFLTREPLQTSDELHPAVVRDQPPLPEAPSLFRSRSFAALLDLSIAVAIFVLTLLLFPDPPRVLPFLFAGLYLLTKDSLGLLNGQSIGKKIMGIRVVSRSHRSITGDYRIALLRNLSWFIAPLELAILYVREDEITKGRRLGDDWAKTEVISESKSPAGRSKWLP